MNVSLRLSECVKSILTRCKSREKPKSRCPKAIDALARNAPVSSHIDQGRLSINKRPEQFVIELLRRRDAGEAGKLIKGFGPTSPFDKR